MSKYKLSKYIRIFDDIAEDVILYNSKNRAIVGIPNSFLKERNIERIMPESELKELEELGFFDEGFTEERKEYTLCNSLIVSVETMLACNLACPYCYQIGKKAHTVLSKDSMDSLCKYLEKVWNDFHYKNLVLKVLGGEPSLLWSKTEYVINRCKDFCDSTGVKLQLMIDTNGTIIKDFTKLIDFPSLLFTVPITHKSCHDKVRRYPNGRGTYDEILSNLNVLRNKLPKSDIVIRYNVDKNNVGLFSEFVEDITKKLSFTPILSPNYTMDLGEGDFHNKLLHHDFVEWLSTDCIDVLVKHKLPVTVAPFSLKQKCQCWSPYSLKLFSNGTVGACAMSFFDDERPTIDTLVNGGDMGEKWKSQKSYDVFENIKCSKCPSLFLCGGAYHQPCIKSLNLQECRNGDSLHINLKEFLKRYLLAVDEGKDDLFVGFNTYDIYK